MSTTDDALNDLAEFLSADPARNVRRVAFLVALTRTWDALRARGATWSQAVTALRVKEWDAGLPCYFGPDRATLDALPEEVRAWHREHLDGKRETFVGWMRDAAARLLAEVDPGRKEDVNALLGLALWVSMVRGLGEVADEDPEAASALLAALEPQIDAGGWPVSFRAVGDRVRAIGEDGFEIMPFGQQTWDGPSRPEE